MAHCPEVHDKTSCEHRGGCPNLNLRPAEPVQVTVLGPARTDEEVGPDGEHHHDEHDAKHPRPFRVPADRRPQPHCRRWRGVRGDRSVRVRLRPPHWLRFGSQDLRSHPSSHVLRPDAQGSCCQGCCVPPHLESTGLALSDQVTPGRGTRHPGSAAFVLSRRPPTQEDRQPDEQNKTDPEPAPQGGAADQRDDTHESSPPDRGRGHEGGDT